MAQLDGFPIENEDDWDRDKIHCHVHKGLEDDIAEIGAFFQKIVVELNVEYAVDRSDGID